MPIPSAITQNIGKYHSDEAYAKAVAYIQLVGMLLFIAIFVFANNIAHMMGDSHLTPMIQAASLKLYIYRYAWRVKRLLSICK